MIVRADGLLFKSFGVGIAAFLGVVGFQSQHSAPEGVVKDLTMSQYARFCAYVEPARAVANLKLDKHGVSDVNQLKTALRVWRKRQSSGSLGPLRLEVDHQWSNEGVKGQAVDRLLQLQAACLATAKAHYETDPRLSLSLLLDGLYLSDTLRESDLKTAATFAKNDLLFSREIAGLSDYIRAEDRTVLMQWLLSRNTMEQLSSNINELAQYVATVEGKADGPEFKRFLIVMHDQPMPNLEPKQLVDAIKSMKSTYAPVLHLARLALTYHRDAVSEMNKAISVVRTRSDGPILVSRN